MANDKEPLDVHEVTLRLSVMLQADSPEDAEAAVSEMSIERLGQEIDGGDFIGASQVIASRAVADGQVMHRLLEYGNDGSFFHGAHEVAAKDARNGDMEIVGLQIQQSWSSETLMQLAGNFLRERGLQQAFIAHLEEIVDMENAASLDM